MGLLDRAIKRGVRNAVGGAVEKAVTNAVAPVATNAANRASQSLDAAMQKAIPPVDNAAVAQTTATANANTDAMATAFAGLTGRLEGYATEASKNMKICPACDQPTSADKKFCPNCGAALPEQTVAQGALCPSCGLQNTPGTKFCGGCGAKLPGAIAEENAAAAKDAAVMQQWDVLLPQYPKWNLGGRNFELEESYRDDVGNPIYSFSARGVSPALLEQYRDLLLGSGFRMAGKYPSRSVLYKKVGSVCYCFESSEPFAGDPDSMYVGFMVREPEGGYDYVKPEPKKPTSFRDLFNI